MHSVELPASSFFPFLITCAYKYNMSARSILMDHVCLSVCQQRNSTFVYETSYFYLLPTPAESVGVGMCSPPSVGLFVCLFVRRITQKRMIPRRSKLIWEMTLGYPRNDMVLGLKGQRSRSHGQ